MEIKLIGVADRNGVVGVYRDIFVDEDPWNEYRKCAVCERTYSREESELHGDQCCGVETNLCHTAEDIIASVTSATATVALINNEVVGFCWGRVIAPTELQQHLQNSSSRLAAFASQGGAFFQAISTWQKLLYIDELGVSAANRGSLHLVHGLVVELARAVGANDGAPIVFWTSNQSILMRILAGLGAQLYPAMDGIVLGVIGRAEVLDVINSGDTDRLLAFMRAS